MSYPSRANRFASLWTLVTSGQVASIARRSRVRASRYTSGATPCALSTTVAPRGTSSSSVDEHRALRLEVAHDVEVVDDLLAHVDRRAEGLQGALHGLDGAVDPRAVAARRGQQDLDVLPGPSCHAPAGRATGGGLGSGAVFRGLASFVFDEATASFRPFPDERERRFPLGVEVTPQEIEDRLVHRPSALR